MNFLGMGPLELLLIIVLALIVFGPAKLPEIMGQIGKAVNDFRRATSDLSEEFNKTIQAELAEGKSVVDEAKAAMTDARSAVTEVHSSVNSAITMPAPVRVAEPNAAATPNGTASNGVASTEPKPALADTSQWSWETAAPPVPKPTEFDHSVADAVSTESMAIESPASHGVSPDAPVVPAETESKSSGPTTADSSGSAAPIAPGAAASPSDGVNAASSTAGTAAAPIAPGAAASPSDGVNASSPTAGTAAAPIARGAAASPSDGVNASSPTAGGSAASIAPGAATTQSDGIEHLSPTAGTAATQSDGVEHLSPTESEATSTAKPKPKPRDELAPPY